MQTRRTVLVVDDDPDVVASVSAVFHEFQFQVFSTQTPGHALGIVQQPTIPLDLMVTDVHMPQMNGIELATAVRKVRPATPVIYMSGDQGAALLVPAKDKRSSFLLKPFTLQELQDMVHSVLGLPVKKSEKDGPALSCRKCASLKVRHSQRHAYEWLAWPVLVPYRCRECRNRFYLVRVVGSVVGVE